MKSNYIYTVEYRWDEKNGCRNCQVTKTAYRKCSDAMELIMRTVQDNPGRWECEKPEGLNCILQMKGYGQFAFACDVGRDEPTDSICTVRLEKILIKGGTENERSMAEAAD